ncbi:quinoprotein relay system zinc metallohydrolase 2 [Paracoccus ravus]|uniref:quinoprotein relay system zinc metallohydrolase 2 n=1 Tax=Paracoccus ravus TaxID=2447760 RepID=UPI00106DFAC9|nr:quinoprotein relay system zinc metallohydrolase 2 [Paracoccus ravus]
MFHLVLATCLVSDPAICAERLLPAADAQTEDECRSRAEPIARDWLARHGDLRGGEARCVETGELPALLTHEIASGVHLREGAVAQLSPQNRGQIANLAFIVGDTVAVIDAGTTRSEGEALYAAIRRITDRPVSHLILTHMHPDHVLGAEVFAEAGASIVGNAGLAEALARRGEAWMMSIPDQIGREVFLGTRIAPVDQSIERPTTIPLGSTRLQLNPQPRAHTDNDLTVHDEESGVFFAGDLIMQGLTPSLDGSLSGWLDWIAAGPPDPQPSLIVPGHGAIQEDWDDAVAPQLTYLSSLRDATMRAVTAGMPLSQAIGAIVTMMKPWSEGWADFEATTARNAATAFAQMEWE